MIMFLLILIGLMIGYGLGVFLNYKYNFTYRVHKVLGIEIEEEYYK